MQFADELENSSDLQGDIIKLIRRTLTEHKRIIFNGNNYSDEWVEEAGRRGLLNLKSTPDALPRMLDEKNIALFERHHVLSRAEIESRYEIYLENYSKTIHIEALTMTDMIRKAVLPAILSYETELSGLVKTKKEIGIESSLEEKLLVRMSALSGCLYNKLTALEEAVIDGRDKTEALECARYNHDSVFASMLELRTVCDELESMMPEEKWPYPAYAKLLYSVV